MSKLIGAVRPFLLPLVLPINAMIRSLSAATHFLQYGLQWGAKPVPEWFDTYIGQHYRWKADSVSWMWDRGVYSVLGMKEGARVLDICCGGGFFTRHFYAGRGSQVVGVDFDPVAIRFARRYNAAPNIKYEIHDIRDSLPDGPFDNVVWDGAVEHFTQNEIDRVCSMIKARMTTDGVLSCYTIHARDDGKFSHPLHEYEFSSKADLARFFRPHFKNVLVFETIYAERHNLHLLASDGALPFSPEWKMSQWFTRADTGPEN